MAASIRASLNGVASRRLEIRDVELKNELIFIK